MSDDAVLKARIEGEYAGGPAFAKAEADAKSYQEIVKRASSGMTDEYERAYKKTMELQAQLTEKIQRGNAVSAGSIVPVIQQYELLRREVVRVYGSIENAPAKVQQQMQVLSQGVTNQTAHVKGLTQVVQQQTGQFSSWGQYIDANTSKFGAMGNTISAVTKNIGLLSVALAGIAAAAKAVAKDLDHVATGGDKNAWDYAKEFIRQQNEIRKAGITKANRQFGDTAYDLFMGSADPDFAKGVARTGVKPYQGPTRTLADEAAQKRQDEQDLATAKKKSEAAAKVAESIKLQTEAFRFELEILRAAGPFDQADIEYRRDLAVALHGETSAIREAMAARAALVHQAKIDKLNDQFFPATWAQTPGVTMEDTSGNIPSGIVDPDYARQVGVAAEIGRMQDQREEQNRQKDAAFEAEQIAKWRSAHEQFTRGLSDIFADFAFTGGENFGEIAGQRFRELATQGFDEIFAGIFGKPGDPNKKIGFDAAGNAIYQDPSKLYGRDGQALSPTASRNATIAKATFDYATIGVGAYGAAQGANGTRTGSLISGAASGASIGSAIPVLGTAWGAVIGAVVGAIGGYLGEQQRQSEYKFGTPRFDKNGNATFAQNSNVNALEDNEIEVKLQEGYNRSRNDAVKLMMALNIQPKKDTFGAFDVNIQKEASANFMKHLSQWMSGTLPKVGLLQAKEQIKTGFGDLGLGDKKFDQLFAQFGKLDPAKMAAIFTALATGLTKINESMDFLGAKNGFGQNTSWFQGLMAEQKEMKKGFADSLKDDFANILNMGSYLDDLVGEDQIRALGDIGDLMSAVREKEKQEMRAILQLQDQIAAKGQAAIDRYDLMGMVKEDGTPDYERQADFIRTRANEDLRRIGTATNRDQVEESFDDFMARIDQIVQSGYNINQETGDRYRLWAIDQIAIAQRAANARLEQFGRDAQAANDAFMAQFQPIFDRFKTAVDDTATEIGDIGKGFDPERPRKFNEALLTATTSFDGLNESVIDLSVAVDVLVTKINNMQNSSSNLSRGGSSFVSDQVSARMRAG